MKKTLLIISVLALTTNVAAAKTTNVQADDKADYPYFEPVKQTNSDVAAKARTRYFGIQVGFGFQDATGMQTNSENRTTASKLNTEFNSRALSIFWGTDHYQSVTKTPIRTEMSLTLRNSKTISYKSGIDSNFNVRTAGMEVGLDTLMYNIYYDFHNSTFITPYIMGGIGGAIPFTITDNITSASNSSQFYAIKSTGFAFAWSAGVGVNLQVNPNLTVVGGVVYSSAFASSSTFKDDRFAYNPTYSLDGLEAFNGVIGLQFNY